MGTETTVGVPDGVIQTKLRVFTTSASKGFTALDGHVFPLTAIGGEVLRLHGNTTGYKVGEWLTAPIGGFLVNEEWSVGQYKHDVEHAASRDAFLDRRSADLAAGKVTRETQIYVPDDDSRGWCHLECRQVEVMDEVPLNFCGQWRDVGYLYSHPDHIDKPWLEASEWRLFRDGLAKDGSSLPYPLNRAWMYCDPWIPGTTAYRKMRIGRRME